MIEENSENSVVADALTTKQVDRAFKKLNLSSAKLIEIKARVFESGEICKIFSVPANSSNLVVFARFY